MYMYLKQSVSEFFLAYALCHLFQWYSIVGYFRGVYILRILRNENFREDCTREVTTLGTWVWFSINFTKINSANRSNFEIREIYTPRK